MSCTDSRNCSSGDLYKECYQKNNFIDKVDFCECSTYFGWTGDDCNEISFTLYWWRIFETLIILWTLFVILSTSRSLYIYIKGRYGKEKLTEINPVFFALLLVWLGAWAFSARSFIVLKAAFDPTYFEILDFDSSFGETQLVVRKNHTFAELMLVIGGILLGLACLQIIISWLNLVTRITQIFPTEGFYFSEATMKKIVIVITFIAFIVMLTFGTINFDGGFTLVFAFESIVLSIGFSIGYFRITRYFNEYKLVKTNTVKNVMNLVKTSCMINAVSLIGVLIGTATHFFLFSEFKEILKIGGVNYIAPIGQFSRSCGIVMMTYISYYGHTVTCKYLGENRQWVPCFSYFTKPRQTTTLTNRGTSKTVV